MLHKSPKMFLINNFTFENSLLHHIVQKQWTHKLVLVVDDGRILSKIAEAHNTKIK